MEFSFWTSLTAVLSEGDAHCRAGESTPVDNPATRVAGRVRRVASRLTPCGWRERPPSSRSAMARTAAEKAAALAVEQRDAQCAAARRAKRTSWAAIDPPDDEFKVHFL